MSQGSFLESTPPDITESIPTSISARIGNPVYVNKTVAADVVINDMAFMLAIDDEHTYQRQTSDFRRQQIDTSKESGEQSLNQWWVRDQSSWHHGAGVNFYEPGSIDTTEYRYAKSMGVDVWTQGQATLLKSCSQLVAVSTGQDARVASIVLSGQDALVGLAGGTMFRHDGTTRTSYTGGTGLLGDPVVTGAKILSGSTSGLWAGDATGTTLTNLWTTTYSGPTQCWWVKSRIIASQGPKLIDLTLAGGSIDSQTPLYTHPDPGWTWVSMTSAPAAIMAAGYSNGYGAIYQFVLTDAGSNLTPTLGSAILIADFPPGEEVHSLESYLSQYIAIGTSKGVRIGTMTSNYTITGVNVTYGPLTILTSSPVTSLSASDRFVYAGIASDLDGNSGLARIDLSSEVDTQRFAWAYDAQAHVSGPVRSVSFLGVSGRVAFGIQGKGIYLQSPTLYEPSGYIQSGKVRYDTSEPKAFNFLKIRAQIPDQCGISIDTIREDGTDEFISRLTSAWDTSTDLTLRTLSDIPSLYASIVMTIDSGANFLTTPILQSMQLKATPKPRIQRDVQYPLRLIDFEQDRNGQKYGHNGYAIERLLMLEDMEQNSSVILVTDYTSGESYTAEIRQIAFTRDTPPDRNRRNFGGRLVVTLLKL